MKKSKPAASSSKLYWHIVLFLPALFIYWRTYSFDFSTLDDEWLILKSTAFLESWESILQSFKVLTNKLYYRPVLSISFIIDYHFFGTKAGGYHLSNLILHICTIQALYLLLLELNVSFKHAVIMCVWFSIHPLCTSAVTWIPGRNDILLSLFTSSVY